MSEGGSKDGRNEREVNTMKTYYFDNSARVYGKKLVVITETAFCKMQEEDRPEAMHNWLYGEFHSLEEAKEYFQKNFMEG